MRESNENNGRIVSKRGDKQFDRKIPNLKSPNWKLKLIVPVIEYEGLVVEEQSVVHEPETTSETLRREEWAVEMEVLSVAGWRRSRDSREE